MSQIPPSPPRQVPRYGLSQPSVESRSEISRKPVPERSELGRPETERHEEHGWPGSEAVESQIPVTGVRETNDAETSFTHGHNHGGKYGPAAIDRSDSSSSVAIPKNSNTAGATLLTDCAVVLLPLVFVVFTILVWRLDGTPVGYTLSAWRNVINVCATLFPILYAAIAGRLMSESARWKLEKGGTMGFLEQLMCSRTVGSTILTIFQLQIWNWLTLGLLIGWAFSPLGAQAILRMMDSRLQKVVQPVNITYFDDEQGRYQNGIQGLPGSLTDLTGTQATFGNLAILYNLLISTPKAIKLDSMDPWGNVRIPVMGPDETTEWKSIPGNSPETNYASLTGIPVEYGNADNSSFSIESNYIHLDCYNATKFPHVGPNGPINYDKDSRANFTEEWPIVEATPEERKNYPNGTWYGWDPVSDSDRPGTGQWGVAIDRFSDYLWSLPNAKYEYPTDFADEEGIEVGPTNLLLRLSLKQKNQVMRTQDQMEFTCGITQKYVESNVSCSRPLGQRTCEVVAQRLSQRKHASELISRLSFPRVFAWVSRELPVATGRTEGGMIDTTIYYLKDPTFANISAGIQVYMDDLDADLVGLRFSQLLNTYLALAQMSGVITNGSIDGAPMEPSLTALGESSRLLEVFVISKVWVSLCLLAALVLVAVGVVSVIFAHLAHGPEVLGYVSTLVRNSKFIDLPPSMSWLDGSDFTNQVKKMRIRNGFVSRVSGEEPLLGVGHEQDTDSIQGFARKK